MEKVLLLHGYNGIPKLFHWLKDELEQLGYLVIMPSLPPQTGMRYPIWKKEIECVRKELDGELIVIAHSGGNPFIIRYAKEENLKIKLYVGLAGFSDRFVTDGREDLNEAVESLVPSNEEIEAFKNNVETKYCLYSIDDHMIPFEILKKHADNIDGKHVMIPGVGHMGSRSGLCDLPKVIEIIEENKIKGRRV